MPSYAVSRRTALVPLSLALVAALGTPLAAQIPIHGIDINAAADSGHQRSPLLFGSAYVAPRGSYGLSFQQERNKSSAQRTFFLDAAPTTAYREQFASTVSAWWGARDWLTVGGSFGVTTNTFRSYESDGTTTAPANTFFSSSNTEIGDLRAFARARLFRSASGATQIAANVGASALLPQSYYNRGHVGTSVGLALAQRVGPLTLHLAPSYEMGNGASFGQLAGAVVVPVLPRVTLSLEGVATGAGSGTWGTPMGRAAFDVGGGLRFDLGRVKLDVGLRHSLGPTTGPDAASRFQFLIGTHVKF